ncbi:MAG: hypothetical protein A2X94_02700 [Bdellovibrionales bacterium GWB1_55_8]|nr:MAG: hypothetical protein A2X94_02700 [Bdellovibrionales bacterium GWB1_55_8]
MMKKTILQIIPALLIPALASALLISTASAETARRPGLVKPRDKLFSHKSHLKPFESLGVSCTDCHTFSIKPEETGPMGRQVKEKLLKPAQGICHSCHLGKITIARRQQCTLCHADTGALQPESHFQNWKTRHGKLSQQDSDSCSACHVPRDCTSCHNKQNRLDPQVHRPNFRVSHSIDARAEPQSCTQCHRRASFCMDCHTGRRK